MRNSLLDIFGGVALWLCAFALALVGCAVFD